MGAPTRSEWLYAGKAFMAGALAFYLALRLQLPNPYWSFATVYIVSHPLSGATRSKAAFRAFGTIVGAAAALLLVSAFAESPMVLIAALGAWLGVALYLSLGDNTPAAYAFLLASYTAPLIAVPAMLAPASIFDVALARTEEILLGIACAGVVSTALFPARVSPVFHARVTALMADAGEWAGRRIGHLGEASPPPLRLRLLTDVLALDALITHLSFDSTRRGQASEARQLRMRMTMLVPQVASLADTLTAMDRAGVPRPDALQTALDGVMAWMAEGSAGAIDHRPALVGARPARETPLTSLAFTQLAQLVDLWQDCLLLHASFPLHATRSPVLRYRTRVLDHEARHDDRGRMLLAAASPAVAFVIAGWVWLVSGWPAGAGGVVLVALSTAFFAAADDPSRQVGRFVVWQAIAVATAAFYLFWVFPQVTTFMGVVLSMAPPFIVVGAYVGRPTMTTGVVLVTSQTISAIALQNNTAVPFEDFANSGIGMMLGLAFALGWTLVTRPLAAASAARRLMLANSEDLAASRDSGTRVLDRTLQWLPGIGLATGEPLVQMEAVRDMRLSVALDELQMLRLPQGGTPSSLGEVLRLSRAYFGECVAHGGILMPPTRLLDAIDHAMHVAGADDTRTPTALLGYRLALAVHPSLP